MKRTVSIPLAIDSWLDVSFRGPVDEQYRVDILRDISKAIHMRSAMESYSLSSGTPKFTGIAGMIDIVFDPNLPSKTAYLVSPLSPLLLQLLQQHPTSLSELPNYLLQELHAKLIHIAGLPEEKGND